ncbi:MAG: glycosyltransferase [Winogradskyella sp.]|uniref:glycosyltransferase family 4 protein n=1 Tax=Winogradskyella sp. TaxID=1883156 RepID=UPI000F41EF2D|nr:glycosyltransferase family 4 protein [Winogradskyella sp.]RNC86892.1 MAG: glycosyltransferase [Winogradskyella sp.]
MKIGIVLAKAPSYSETFFNSKIKGLIDNGYDVTLFVRETKQTYSACKVVSAPKIHRNIVLQIFKTIWVFFKLLPYLKRVLKFFKLEKSNQRNFSSILKNVYTNSHIIKANIDWLHFGFATLALGSEHVSKAIGAKMAVSCRGYDMDVYPLKHPNCYDLVWKLVDKVHAISNYMLSRAYKIGLPADKPKKIIYPAINPKLFDLNYTRSKKDRILLTTIARLHWIKGIDYTIEALGILKTEGVDFEYQIIGEGIEFEALRYTIHELDLEDNVRFIGKLTHKETIKILAETDIYIQYSISEGFCNAVLEAQAMQCLCVVSDGGALPENIINNKTGFVVPKRKPELLASTLKEIMSQDEKVLHHIKQNAAHRVFESFTVEQQIKAFIEFYE